MKGQQQLFSTGKDNYGTPQWLFNDYNAVYHFGLDAAADAQNHKCPVWFGPDGLLEDALTANWCGFGNVWCNPPYSIVGKFVEKAWKERILNNATTAMLIPSRTDTKWFHTYIWDDIHHRTQNGIEIRPIKGRLKFVDPDGKPMTSAPFPSMIVIFRGERWL